jgi:VanZ family protein
MVFSTVEIHTMKRALSCPRLACETTQFIFWYSSVYTCYIYDSNCNVKCFWDHFCFILRCSTLIDLINHSDSGNTIFSDIVHVVVTFFLIIFFYLLINTLNTKRNKQKMFVLLMMVVSLLQWVIILWLHNKQKWSQKHLTKSSQTSTSTHFSHKQWLLL